MAIYHGVVKGNAIVLPAGVELEEGTEVEVRPLANSEVGTETPEQRFRRKLREAGLVLNFPEPSQRRSRRDFEPIKLEIHQTLQASGLTALTFVSADVEQLRAAQAEGLIT